MKSITITVGVALIILDVNNKVGKKINVGYTGEVLVVLSAVQKVKDTRPLISVICSDSCSSLVSLQCKHSESRPDILIEIQQTLYRLNMMEVKVRVRTNG